jgi:uncharacterized phiE125 gp8 family phage protein
MCVPQLITAPASEPITLAEAKLHLRVDGTDEDTLITSQITAARQAAEQFMGRAIISQTWRAVLDAWPTGDVIELRQPWVRSITAVRYIDGAGVQQTLANTEYRLVDRGENDFGRLQPAFGKSWPGVRNDAAVIEIDFVAGWTDAASVPQTVKSAVKFMLGHLYANRESVALGTIATEVPQAFHTLLWPHRTKVVV